MSFTQPTPVRRVHRVGNRRAGREDDTAAFIPLLDVRILPGGWLRREAEARTRSAREFEHMNSTRKLLAVAACLILSEVAPRRTHRPTHRCRRCSTNSPRSMASPSKNFLPEEARHQRPRAGQGVHQDGPPAPADLLGCRVGASVSSGPAYACEQRGDARQGVILPANVAAQKGEQLAELGACCIMVR